VARVLGVSRCSIQRAVNRFPETKGYTRRVGSGRKRSTTAHDDHFLTLTIPRNRDNTAVRARNELQEVRSVAVSERTVRKMLEEHGLSARTLAYLPTCLLLTREHRVARLLIADEHRNWGIKEWGRILFTDESKFCLRSPDGRQRVWRSTGQRVAQCNFVPGISFGSGSIMVWGGISMEARTELVVVNGGAMTANRYIRDILEPHVVPFAPFIGNDSILIHDNARPHIAQIVNEYLGTVEIHHMIWPARSPNLNPIEHVWDMVGRRVKDRTPAPANLRDLSAAVIQECQEIHQAVIQDLFEGMPRRMEAVIQARGGNIRLMSFKFITFRVKFLRGFVLFLLLEK
jgi:transposase